ncbi:MAG: clostripain-related cysteine peptidase [Methanospirillum sp.]|nr:clostripain-related cysteine peptidase [Methanospirillum sp.]
MNLAGQGMGSTLHCSACTAHKIEMNTRILVLLCIVWCTVAIACGDPSGTNGTETKNLLLIYMIGGDLETDYQTGTDNLQEIIRGYGNASPQDLTVCIAYGGSKTPGWEGVTYAGIGELRNDAADGVIGNDPGVRYHDPKADMGNRKTLEDFLSMAGKTWPADRRILLFWDHGSGYEGFGVDERTDSQLTLDDLKQALLSSGMRYDLIGFDACLMGSIEVASALQPYGSWMVASEETEPGNGWNYTDWMEVLSSQPDIPLEDLGVSIVDSYMEQEDTGKTLSVINLSKVPALISGLDALGKNLDPFISTPDGYRIIGRAYQVPARYGTDNREWGETSIDLRSLLQAVQEQASGEIPDIGQITDILNETVTYHRNDEYIQDSGGISIMSPSRIDPDIYTELGDDARLTPGWDSFFSRLLDLSTQDTEKPEFSSIQDNTYQVEDPTGTAQTSVEYYLYDEGDMILLGDEPAAADSNGSYQIPDWNGEWFYLQDNLDPENYALLGMSYDSVVPGGSMLFTSEIDLAREKIDTAAVLDVYINQDTGANRLVATPYTIRNDREIQFSRQNLVLQPGDRITTYGWELPSDKNEEGDWISIGEMNVSEDTKLIYDTLPDGFYAEALYTGYDTKNGDYTGIRVIGIKNGEVTVQNDLNTTAGSQELPDELP